MTNLTDDELIYCMNTLSHQIMRHLCELDKGIINTNVKDNYTKALIQQYRNLYSIHRPILSGDPDKYRAYFDRDNSMIKEVKDND